MILDDYKEDKWFGLLGEIALKGDVIEFFQAQIDELNNVILSYPPGINAEHYHVISISNFAKKELLQQQLNFFQKLKEEFDVRIKEQ